MIKVLQPIRHREAYTRELEREIIGWMREAIFTPLLLVLQEHAIDIERTNEVGPDNALTRALASGQVQYQDGYFSGHFSADISRELRAAGATWEATSKRFALEQAQLPYEIRGTIALAAAAATAAHEAIIRTLTTIEQHVAESTVGIDIGPALDAILRDLQKQYRKTTTGIENVEVKAEISEHQRAELDRMLTNNLDLSVKNWTAEQIPELRQMVERNMFSGSNTTRLTDLIQSKFGVGQRKAEFLADHETGMLTAKYARIQAEEIGCQEYIWSTSGDVRVRDDHRHLDGQRFSFNSPPITNRATGARNNPGEDFRCRCVAKPIIHFPS